MHVADICGTAIFINGTIMTLGGQTNNTEEYVINKNKWVVENIKLPAKMTYHHAVAFYKWLKRNSRMTLVVQVVDD
jgi:frataxin-like iron-binding protein CyaY